MLLSFIRGSKFRQWSARADCPAALQACKQLLDCMLDGGEDTTPLSDAFKTQKSPRSLLALVGTPTLRMASYILRDGLGFRADTSYAPGSIGNSLVIVRMNPDERRPACITHIYSRNGEIKFAVRYLQSLPQGSPLPRIQDRFDDVPAALYGSEFEDILQEVALERVEAHFAFWRLRPGLSLVMNLDKVSGDHPSEWACCLIGVLCFPGIGTLIDDRLYTCFESGLQVHIE